MMNGWAAAVSTERPARSEPPLRASLRLVWLVGLTYAVASATSPGTSGRHLTALVLTATTALGWGGWLASRHWHNDGLSALSIAVLAASGGVIEAVLNHIGILVVGIAGMCAASLFELVPAAALAATGVVAATIGYAAHSSSATVIVNAASGAASGVVVGVGRRQQDERARRDADLAVARQRTEVEHERAEVLAERNRIAREVHDVLAHTLSALSVQMEALDSLVASGADGTLVRNGLQRSRQLVVSGLEETRQAVRALRDEPVAVADQVATAASDSGADVTVVGTPRPLSAAHGLALVRVAQEALTNVRKHAAGAPTTVTLEFLQSSVRVTVANDISAGEQSTLASTGGGFGLRGMQERIELLGGSLSAGTSDDASTWRVEAVVPT
jgi:signal transduction histidine kinase